MDFQFVGLLVLLHVLFASLWVGAAIYQVTVIGPALMRAGPAAGGFLAALARRGGIGRYFAAAGALTITFGGWLYGYEHAHKMLVPFQGRGLWITLGAIVAILGFLHAVTMTIPVERKWMRLTNSLRGPPTPEQGAQLQAYGMKLGKSSAISATMVGLALLLMLMSRVLT